MIFALIQVSVSIVVVEASTLSHALNLPLQMRCPVAGDLWLSIEAISVNVGYLLLCSST